MSEASIMHKLDLELNRFNKYSSLFQSLNRLSVRSSINSCLGIHSSTVLPLALPHGIQPIGHRAFIQDSHLIEPLFWAFNTHIEARLPPSRQSVLLPHPWFFCLQNLGTTVARSNKCLLLGPPPSKANDESLFALTADFAPDSILIKNRGSYVSRSIAFWASKGLTCHIANSYDDLAALFQSYESLLCPTLSSAIFLASVAGCKVQLIKNYPHLCYGSFNELSSSEPLSLLREGWINVVKSCDNEASLHSLSLKTLGFQYLSSAEDICELICEKVSSLDALLYIPEHRSRLSYSLANILLAANCCRASFFSYGFRNSLKSAYLSKFVKRKIPKVRVCSVNDFIALRPNEVVDYIPPSSSVRNGFGANPW